MSSSSLTNADPVGPSTSRAICRIEARLLRSRPWLYCNYVWPMHGNKAICPIGPLYRLVPPLSNRFSPYAMRPLSVIQLSCLSVTLVYCGRTAKWIKMPLGTEVGLGRGHIVLDGDPAPPPQRGIAPIFGPCLLWPNGWMDEDAT